MPPVWLYQQIYHEKRADEEGQPLLAIRALGAGSALTM